MKLDTILCLIDEKYLQKRSHEKDRTNKLVLENMKNPEINICELIESKMNEIIDTINKMGPAIEAAFA